MAKQTTRTEWFPSSVQPVRNGIYETRTVGSALTTYRKFQNGVWLFQRPDKDYQLSAFGSTKKGYWRGLTEAAYKHKSLSFGNRG